MHRYCVIQKQYRINGDRLQLPVATAPFYISQACAVEMRLRDDGKTEYAIIPCVPDDEGIPPLEPR